MTTQTNEPVDGRFRQPPKIERSSGILMHITSLPSRFGIGSLGPEAHEFARFLSGAGQTFWQVLPLGPVSPAFGFSPYSSLSTFAGNEMLISLDTLVRDGWLAPNDLPGHPANDSEDFADLNRVWTLRRPLLERAAENFYRRTDPETEKESDRFCRENRYWLDDYALYMALGETFQTFHWPDWDRDVARRSPAVLSTLRRKLKKQVDLFRFLQFMFFRQWQDLKRSCTNLGIRLIGDIPFYVNFDSADAWANRDIFQLHPGTGEPLAVAGVPPDYFSKTGQRWGNPVYRWNDRDGKFADRTCDWWISRLCHMTRQADWVRIDHFRGFESYWAIPAEAGTAVSGNWLKGPGYRFFQTVQQQLGHLPLIAEDLGIITPEVEVLRDRLSLPGMKILQFAFDRNPDNPYLPHNFRNPNCIVYTGTHDNNTSNGWFYGAETDEPTKRYILDYLGITERDEFHWQFIRLAMGSTAALSIFPMQDILGYGGEFRLNTPGNALGNWSWKLQTGKLNPEISGRLRQMTNLYGRLPQKNNPREIADADER
jgi:4-alpha-glucanotransferase